MCVYQMLIIRRVTIHPTDEIDGRLPDKHASFAVSGI